MGKLYLSDETDYEKIEEMLGVAEKFTYTTLMRKRRPARAECKRDALAQTYQNGRKSFQPE